VPPHGCGGQVGGASSSGITQNPREQTVPEQSAPHWLSSRQAVRQMASTHIHPGRHWALAVHWGTGRVSGRQTPRSHRSAGFGQAPLPSPAAGWAQRWWQNPFMQTRPSPQAAE
jgi:hypothetical protein